MYKRRKAVSYWVYSNVFWVVFIGAEVRAQEVFDHGLNSEFRKNAIEWLKKPIHTGGPGLNEISAEAKLREMVVNWKRWAPNGQIETQWPTFLEFFSNARSELGLNVEKAIEFSIHNVSKVNSPIEAWAFLESYHEYRKFLVNEMGIASNNAHSMAMEYAYPDIERTKGILRILREIRSKAIDSAFDHLGPEGLQLSPDSIQANFDSKIADWIKKIDGILNSVDPNEGLLVNFPLQAEGAALFNKKGDAFWITGQVRDWQNIKATALPQILEFKNSALNKAEMVQFLNKNRNLDQLSNAQFDSLFKQLGLVGVNSANLGAEAVDRPISRRASQYLFEKFGETAEMPFQVTELNQLLNQLKWSELSERQRTLLSAWIERGDLIAGEAILKNWKNLQLPIGVAKRMWLALAASSNKRKIVGPAFTLLDSLPSSIQVDWSAEFLRMAKTRALQEIVLREIGARATLMAALLEASDTSGTSGSEPLRFFKRQVVEPHSGFIREPEWKSLTFNWAAQLPLVDSDDRQLFFNLLDSTVAYKTTDLAKLTRRFEQDNQWIHFLVSYFRAQGDSAVRETQFGLLNSVRGAQFVPVWRQAWLSTSHPVLKENLVKYVFGEAYFSEHPEILKAVFEGLPDSDRMLLKRHLEAYAQTKYGATAVCLLKQLKGTMFPDLN